MTINNKQHLLTLIIGAAFIVTATTQVPAEQFSDGQKSQIEQIIHDYLLENPQVVEDAMQELERRKTEEERVAAITTIRENSDVLFWSNRHAVLGNPDGDVTLVEFFDYNCGYCKRALVDILKLLDEDENIRLVLKEFPVLGKPSLEAARVSIAASRVDPNKYVEFHQKLLLGQSRANRETAMALAQQLNFDMDALNEEMEGSEILATLEEVYDIAAKLKLTGTPSFVIGEEVVNGAIPMESMKEKVNLTRTTDSQATAQSQN